MTAGHLEGLKRRVRDAVRSPPPAPWVCVADLAVGGLSAVGFDRHSERLLIVSSQGRGLVDCTSGQRLARDHGEYYGDEQQLEAEAIGPLAGTIIRMAGLHGGGLPLTTEDGWSLELVTMDWPHTDVLLLAPGSWLYGSLHGKESSFYKIATDSELRACGFSYTGRSLVVATSSDLVIYARS